MSEHRHRIHVDDKMVWFTHKHAYPRGMHRHGVYLQESGYRRELSEAKKPKK